MTLAPATTAPMKYLHAKPNIKPTNEHSPYSNPDPHIKLNLKTYHNPNPNPNSLEKLRSEQLSPGQMSCHLRVIEISPGHYVRTD